MSEDLDVLEIFPHVRFCPLCNFTKRNISSVKNNFMKNCMSSFLSILAQIDIVIDSNDSTTKNMHKKSMTILCGGPWPGQMPTMPTPKSGPAYEPHDV